MGYANHTMVVLLHYSVESIREEEFLKELIMAAVTQDTFCQVHELAGRNRISRKKYKLLGAIRQRHLPAFHFLINRN